MQRPLFKSFTLVEMLIVIVIIGILMLALIPRLRGVMDRANEKKRQMDCRNTCLEENMDDPTICSSCFEVPCDHRDVKIGRYQLMACNIGTTISGTGKESFGEFYSWTDAQTLCPEGYRLPTTLEWDEVIKTWFTTYGRLCNVPANGNCSWSNPATNVQFRNDFLFPATGFRVCSNLANVQNPNDYGEHWSSTTGINNSPYHSEFNSSTVKPQDNNSGGEPMNYFCLSVRCFKN